MTKPTIAVLGTLDTKGIEHQFLADVIRALGCEVLLIDIGTGSATQVKPDIDRYTVASSAGIELQPVLDRHDRGEAVATMTTAAPELLKKLCREGRIQGVISLGGGGGTAIASAAMRVLPIGFPKLIVSTLAAGQTAHYVGTKDIVMMPSIVDIQGINRISEVIFRRAAGAIAGMVQAPIACKASKPIIVASMFGNTTQCINASLPIFQEAEFETLVFAATGTGGLAMESLIESQFVAGVYDITTTELADEVVGGVLTAGPHRMKAVGLAGVPSVVAPGCLDMVNFGEPSTVPSKFQGRKFYRHNAQVTLMRTTADECRTIGKMLADAVNTYSAPTTVLIPRRALSIISAAGQPFHDPEADDALFESIQTNLSPGIPCEMHDLEINDSAFATLAADRLLANIRQHMLRAS